MRNPVRCILGFDGKFDKGKTGPGKRLDEFEFLQILDREFDPVGHLQFHLFRAGAGIGGHDHRGLDGEFRVLELAEAEEAAQAADDQQENDKIGDDRFLDRDRG